MNLKEVEVRCREMGLNISSQARDFKEAMRFHDFVYLNYESFIEDKTHYLKEKMK